MIENEEFITKKEKVINLVEEREEIENENVFVVLDSFNDERKIDVKMMMLG